MFVLVVNFLLVDGRKLSNWENDEERNILDLTVASKVCANYFFYPLCGRQTRERKAFISSVVRVLSI